MRSQKENNEKELAPHDYTKYQNTIKYLQSQTHTLEKKVLTIHSELKKKFIENIDLEKKHLDLIVEANELKGILAGMYIPACSDNEINWKHKYEVLYRFLINLKSHLLVNQRAFAFNSEIQSLFANSNAYEVERAVDIGLVNESLKRIDTFDNMRVLNLQSEIDKNHLIEHLKHMNYEIVAKNKAVFVKIEELKSQISYLLDLLNENSGQKYEKLLGMVKDLTMKNTKLTIKLYSGVETNNKYEICSVNSSNIIYMPSSPVDNCDVNRNVEEDKNTEFINLLKEENKRAIEKTKNYEMSLLELRSELEGLKINCYNMQIENNFKIVQVENYKEKLEILERIKMDYDAKNFENKKQEFYIIELNRRIKELEDQIREKEDFYNKYVLISPENNKFMALINELNIIKERNNENCRVVATMKELVNILESRLSKIKANLKSKRRKIRRKRRKIVKLKEKSKDREIMIQGNLESRLKEALEMLKLKEEELTHKENELKSKNDTIGGILMKNEDEVISLLTRDRSALAGENERLKSLVLKAQEIERSNVSSIDLNQMQEKNKNQNAEILKLKNEIEKIRKTSLSETKQSPIKNGEYLQISNNEDTKIIFNLNEKLKSKDAEIEKCLHLIEKLKKIKDEYVKLKKYNSISENLSVN